MNISSGTTRLLLGIGFMFVTAALFLSLIDWTRGTLSFAAPKLVDQLGLLLLMSALLFVPSRPAMRKGMVILALLLIVPSSALILWHFL